MEHPCIPKYIDSFCQEQGNNRRIYSIHCLDKTIRQSQDDGLVLMVHVCDNSFVIGYEQLPTAVVDGQEFLLRRGINSSHDAKIPFPNICNMVPKQPI